MAAVGFAAATVALLAIVIVGDTFGFPGSGRYRTYETLNRAMGIILVFEALSLVAYYLRHRERIGKVARTIWIITIAAWLGLAVATAAEFWLYSDLPYGEVNMRSIAFTVFSLSDLLVGLGLLSLAIKMLRQRTQSRLLAVTLFTYLPLTVLVFAVGGSIFLPPTLVSMCLATVVLGRGQMAAAQDDANGPA